MGEQAEVYVERTIVMPSELTMLKKLDAARLPLKQQGVLFRFTHSIAEQAETASTLVAAWEGACEDANKKLPLWRDKRITQLLHTFAFPSVADAIIPDRQVAQDAKDELKCLEKIRS